MSWLLFDIETEPLPKDVLQKMMPEFDPGSVKLGNLKDEEKIKAKISQARESHAETFLSKATLDPLYSRVLVIAAHSPNTGKTLIIDENDEQKMLLAWWKLYLKAERSGTKMAGVNIFGFDLPFLVKRSWSNQILIPPSVVNLTSKWTDWSPIFFDLRSAYQLGDRQALSSFDRLGKAFGTGGKNAGDHGALFYTLWRDKEKRDVAMAYLRNDVKQPVQWLIAMGLIKESDVK